MKSWKTTLLGTLAIALGAWNMHVTYVPTQTFYFNICYVWVGAFALILAGFGLLQAADHSHVEKRHRDIVLKTGITLLLALCFIGTAAAIEVKVGEVPKQTVPVEYAFTEPEVIDALKVAILKKYPNSDVSAVTTKLAWTTAVWFSGFDNGAAHTNIFLTLNQQPNIVKPSENGNGIIFGFQSPYYISNDDLVLRIPVSPKGE